MGGEPIFRGDIAGAARLQYALLPLTPMEPELEARLLGMVRAHGLL